MFKLLSPSSCGALITLDFVSAMTDNTSVNYVQYKGDYYLSSETNFMNKVDIETLEKTEKVKCRLKKMNKTDPQISFHSE